MATAKRILQSVLPPLLWNAGKDLKRRLFRSVDHHEYAPHGWSAASLPPGSDGEAYWNPFLEYERQFVQALIPRVRAGDPILFPGRRDEARHIYYAYVLALASQGRQRLAVLDYGGHLGADYWLGKALVPGVELSYVCKELPAIAAAGRDINDAVTFAADDSCLAQSYDLVMFSGSLQCVRDWRGTLDRAAAATRGYLFLSDIPAVRSVATFVATQRSRGQTILLHHFNRDELVAAVEAGGLRLVREFSPGEYPRVAGAPEQPRYGAWLFARPR